MWAGHTVDEFETTRATGNEYTDTAYARCTRKKVAPGDIACIINNEGGITTITCDFNTTQSDGTSADSFLCIDSSDNLTFMAVSITGTVFSGQRCSRGLALTRLHRVNGFGNQVIISVAAGRHCLAVSDTGAAFAWGLNDHGQCGFRKEDSSFIDTPRHIELPIYRFQCAAVGGIGNGHGRLQGDGAHSLLLTTDGILYSFGSNEHGQLGRGCASDDIDYEAAHIPSRVHGIDGGCVISFAAGIRHSLAVTESRWVYAWGSNVDSELGIIAESYAIAPTRATASISTWTLPVTLPITPTAIGTRVSHNEPKFNFPVVVGQGAISVSAFQTASSMVTENGKLYTWGTRWVEGPPTSTITQQTPVLAGPFGDYAAVVVNASISNNAVTVETVMEVPSQRQGVQMYTHRIDHIAIR